MLRCPGRHQQEPNAEKNPPAPVNPMIAAMMIGNPSRHPRMTFLRTASLARSNRLEGMSLEQDLQDGILEARIIPLETATNLCPPSNMFRQFQSSQSPAVRHCRGAPQTEFHHPNRCPQKKVLLSWEDLVSHHLRELKRSPHQFVTTVSSPIITANHPQESLLRLLRLSPSQSDPLLRYTSPIQHSLLHVLHLPFNKMPNIALNRFPSPLHGHRRKILAHPAVR